MKLLTKIGLILVCLTFITSLGLNFYFYKYSHLQKPQVISTPQKPIKVSINEEALSKKILLISKENFQAAQNYHGSVKTIAWTFRILFPASILLFLLGLIKHKWVSQWVATKLIKTSGMERKFNVDWARVFVQQGYLHYVIAKDLNKEDPMQNELTKLAIISTEYALNKLQKAIGLKLEVKNETEQKALERIYGNLTYYYALVNDSDKFIEGIIYAKKSLEEAVKEPINYDNIENYLYFIKQFHEYVDNDEKQRAKGIFDNYRNALLKREICTEAEINDYGDFFSNY